MLSNPSARSAFAISAEKRVLVAISMCIVGLAISGVGLLILINKTNSSEVQPCLVATSKIASHSAQTAERLITVDVRGEVGEPGLYEVAADTRVGEVVALAGGFTKMADGEYTQRELNLAQLLSDGDKLYIPSKDERQKEREMNNLEKVTIGEEKVGKVSVNTATLNELDELPGIGEKRAQDIIAGRPYTSVMDLVNQNIISETVFEALAERISL